MKRNDKLIEVNVQEHKLWQVPKHSKRLVGLEQRNKKITNPRVVNNH